VGTCARGGGGGKGAGMKLKPSKRMRPFSVPIQRYPSAVCAIAFTAPPLNLFPAVHSSRTYCDGRRLGSSAGASLERNNSTMPTRVDRIGFNEQITEDTRTCRLRPHFRFSAGSDPCGIRIRRCAPIRPPRKGLLL